MNTSPFTPGPTITITAGTANTTTALAGSGTSVEVQNAGAVTMFVKLGDSTVLAATTDYPVLAGQSKLINRASTQTHLGVITATSSVTAYATTGEGV